MKQERQAVAVRQPGTDNLVKKPSAPESVTTRPGGNRVRGRADKLRREPADEAMKPIDLSAPEYFPWMLMFAIAGILFFSDKNNAVIAATSGIGFYVLIKEMIK